jgi:uncharacterized GH25 family protein
MMNILTKSFCGLNIGSPLKKISIVALLCGTSATALAHTQWLKPSTFNTALDERAVWVTGQLSMAENAFVTERGLIAKSTLILPDGKSLEMTDVYEGKTSSLFDFELTESGTYKIDSVIGPRLRKARKPKDPTKKSRPASRTVNRLTTYITADAPTDGVIKAEGTWLEIIPVTHPADLVEGEPASFKVLYEGKPLAEQTLTLIVSGGEYQNQKTDKEYLSDSEGIVTVELIKTGVYLIKSSHQIKLKGDPEAKVLRASAGLTFEAQLN